MNTIAGVALGAAAGAVVEDIYEKSKEVAQGISGSPSVEHGPIELRLLVELLAEIHKAVIEVRNQSRPDYRSIQLSTGQPYELKRRNFNHVSILLAAATTVVVNTALGDISFNLNVGWNAFDMPDNVSVRLSAGGPTNVIIRWGEDSIDIPGV